MIDTWFVSEQKQRKRLKQRKAITEDEDENPANADLDALFNEENQPAKEKKRTDRVNDQKSKARAGPSAANQAAEERSRGIDLGNTDSEDGDGTLFLFLFLFYFYFIFILFLFYFYFIFILFYFILFIDLIQI